jgi:hypothetical protein
MATLLFHLAISLTAYAIIACVFLGMGRALAGVLRTGFQLPDRYFAHVWLGWVAAILLLQVWHLFLPINAIATLFVFVVGAVLFLQRASKFAVAFRKSALQPVNSLWVLLLVGIASWVALRAMLPPEEYDSGLYHLNTIRWLNEYRIVPGLGNLHARLAYNQSLFLYVASLNLYPFFNHGHNLADSFLFLLVSFECLTGAVTYCRQIFHGHRKTLRLEPLPTLVLPFLIYIVLEHSLSSSTPDFASCLLQLVLVFHLWRLLIARPLSHRAVSEAKFITILSAAAVTVKLSNLVYAFLSAGISLFWCCVRPHFSLRSVWRTFRTLVVSSLLLVGVWMTRGIVMSGCPVFPSTFMCLRLDWSVPLQTVQDEANWIYSWARAPDQPWQQVLGQSEWLVPWFKRMLSDKIEVTYPLAVFVMLIVTLVPILIIFGSSIARNPLQPNFKFMLCLCPSIGGLIFWFLTAPEPRFAGAQFWLLPTASSAALLLNLRSNWIRHSAFAIFLLMFSFPFGYWIVKSSVSRFKDISYVGYMPVKTVALDERITFSGLRVYVPVEGDQSWDSPLPSTPDFNPYLRLRGENLQSGFTVSAAIPPTLSRR